MNRLLRVLLLLVWLDVGLVLVVLPWSMFWESNYFLNTYPGLIPILLNPFVRGAVSGLGLVDAFLAVDAFRKNARMAGGRGPSL